MGILDGKTACGRCKKEIRADESAVPYRDGTLAHLGCAPPRGTRQRWSDAKRRFTRASEREPVWALLLALRLSHEGAGDPAFLLVEEDPYRVSVNGSSPVFIGEPHWSAVQELEELGFVKAKPDGGYELTPEGKEATENTPLRDGLETQVRRGTTPEG